MLFTRFSHESGFWGSLIVQNCVTKSSLLVVVQATSFLKFSSASYISEYTPLTISHQHLENGLLLPIEFGVNFGPFACECSLDQSCSAVQWRSVLQSAVQGRFYRSQCGPQNEKCSFYILYRLLKNLCRLTGMSAVKGSGGQHPLSIICEQEHDGCGVCGHCFIYYHGLKLDFNKLFIILIFF